MDPRAQRLLDLRAELKTIDDLLDIIDDKAERRQYLCDKLATQREVTLIQRGDEASGSTQQNVPDKSAYDAAAAASRASATAKASIPSMTAAPAQHQQLGGSQQQLTPIVARTSSQAVQAPDCKQRYQQAKLPHQSRTSPIYGSLQSWQPHRDKSLSATAFRRGMPRHGPVQHTTKSLDTNQSLVRKAASQAIDQQEPPAKKRRVQPASDINFNRGASRQHYHFEQPKTPYPCVNWKILDYGLIIQRSSGRVFELECCFCHGNVSCGTHPQVFSGVEGLQRHITQGHKETCMRKGFDLSLSKTPSVEWIVRNCVRHELTVEEVEMVRNDAYAVTKNRTTTELQQELMAAFPLANDAFR